MKLAVVMGYFLLYGMDEIGRWDYTVLRLLSVIDLYYTVWVKSLLVGYTVIFIVVSDYCIIVPLVVEYTSSKGKGTGTEKVKLQSVSNKAVE